MQDSVCYGGYLEHTDVQNADILQTCEGLPQAHEHVFDLTKQLLQIYIR